MNREESTRHGIKYSREIIAKFMDCGSVVDGCESCPCSTEINESGLTLCGLLCDYQNALLNAVTKIFEGC